MAERDRRDKSYRGVEKAAIMMMSLPEEVATRLFSLMVSWVRKKYVNSRVL